MAATAAPLSLRDVQLDCQSVETALTLSPRHSPRRLHIQRRLTRSLPYRLLTHQHHSRSHQPLTDLSHSGATSDRPTTAVDGRTPADSQDLMSDTPIARSAGIRDRRPTAELHMWV